MEGEEKLRDVWQWLPVEMPGFSVDLFADAVVSYPGPGHPYEPVERLGRLVASISSLRGVDNVVYKSSNLETACGAVLEGTTFEYVFALEALEGMFVWNPARIVAISTDRSRLEPSGIVCGALAGTGAVGIALTPVTTHGFQNATTLHRTFVLARSSPLTILGYASPHEWERWVD